MQSFQIITCYRIAHAIDILKQEFASRIHKIFNIWRADYSWALLIRANGLQAYWSSLVSE